MDSLNGRHALNAVERLVWRRSFGLRGWRYNVEVDTSMYPRNVVDLGLREAVRREGMSMRPAGRVGLSAGRNKNVAW